MPSAIRTSAFPKSVITEMTRLANVHGAINLSQGYPDFPMPQALKDAACTAIRGDLNQYSVTSGSPALRLAIAGKYRRWYGLEVDHEQEVTVTCGATEAVASVFLALLNPGDKLIILEPFYESYGPDALLAGALPVFVPMRRPDWRLDEAKLRAAFADGARAIVVNTPNNPTGRVFTRDEMNLIAGLCVEHNALAICDEIYEHIRYAGNHHVLASWPGMRERTVIVSGLSKTFSCTGWRLGYAVAPPEESAAIRKIHDCLTVGAPAPLQAAGAVALAFEAEYFNNLSLEYREKRDLMSAMLTEAGFKFSQPEGAYYTLADFSELSDADDVSFAKWMIEEIGVAAVPGSSFFSNPADGRSIVRFAFCKKLETLRLAGERLASMRSRIAV
jgi:aminotransferase